MAIEIVSKIIGNRRRRNLLPVEQGGESAGVSYSIRAEGYLGRDEERGIVGVINARTIDEKDPETTRRLNLPIFTQREAEDLDVIGPGNQEHTGRSYRQGVYRSSRKQFNVEADIVIPRGGDPEAKIRKDAYKFVKENDGDPSIRGEMDPASFGSPAEATRILEIRQQREESEALKALREELKNIGPQETEDGILF